MWGWGWVALRAQAYPKCRINSSNGLQMGLQKFAEQISSLNCLPLGQSAALATGPRLMSLLC